MNTNSKISNIIIGITGASGAIYGYELINQLLKIDQIKKIPVIFSDNGAKVWEYEQMPKIPKNKKIEVFNNNDFFAAPASGSAQYNAMFITPCSMGTLAAIATGTSSNLIHRAADVTLKERRKLILLVREAPLNLIHIKNMETITLAGGIIFPASPFFYNRHEKLNDIVSDLISRLINISGINLPIKEWGK